MPGFAQLLRQPGSNSSAEAQRNLARHIQEAGWHLLRLIDDALDLSDLDGGRTLIDLQPLPLKDVLQAGLKAVATEAAARGVPLPAPTATATASASASASAMMRADPEKLQHALVHVLRHTVPHSQPARALALRVLPGPGSWRIEVHDSGLALAQSLMR